MGGGDRDRLEAIAEVGLSPARHDVGFAGQRSRSTRQCWPPIPGVGNPELPVDPPPAVGNATQGAGAT